MTIGERIKVLRRKNDLTQEKLADYLCVSYQAVSKWETGVSSPDLAMIAPLTKLFHVTADELLGLVDTEPDKCRIELEAAYDETWKTGDLAKRITISETAINEYPGDTKYLHWLASAMYLDALENKSGKEQDDELEKAIQICKTVIDAGSNDEVHIWALQTIVQSLSWLYRYDEAKKYAEMYPEATTVTKDDIMRFCLTGEELAEHKQKMMLKALFEVENELSLRNDLPSLKTAEQIVKLIIPDGNYLQFHGLLYINFIWQAVAQVKNGNNDEAVLMLEKALYHVNEYDSIANEHRVYKYTAPLLNLVEFDTSEWIRGVTGTFIDVYYERLENQAFDPLRDRDDFKKLAERK